VSDPSLDVTLSVITPFVAYIPAEEIGASGVLATVTAGVFVGLSTLDVVEPGTRLRTLAFWQSATFLLDGLLFVLIGVQVPSIYHRIEDAIVLALVGDALLAEAARPGGGCRAPARRRRRAPEAHARRARAARGRGGARRRPSTSSTACATATSRASSAWRRGWRITSERGTDVQVAGGLLAEMIDAERGVLREMQPERAYPADTLRDIERELDLDESRLRARIRL
jgi:sodium/hydrogen exchanger family protein